MQDRIKELAKQFGIDVDQDTLCRHGGWDEPVRNFAQAIARECAEICQRRYEMCLEPEARELAGEISDTFGIAKE